MGVAQKVVDELNKGASQEDLARKYPWASLSKDDSNVLLTVALGLSENDRSYTMLVYLFNISFRKDLWFSTEVLSQTLQHPLMTVLDRLAILPTMRNQLDQLKDLINARVTPPEKLNKYWLMEATYYSVKGNHLADNGNRNEAVQNYQITQSIFEQLGLFKQAGEYKALIKRLQSLDAFRSTLPKTSPIRLRSAQTESISPEALSRAGLQSIDAFMKVESADSDESPAWPAAEISLEAVDTQHPIQAEQTAGARVSSAASAPPAAETAQPDETKQSGLPISGIYYPLPDVWLENGQLHILGINEFKGDESAEQAEQIRQQCEILIALQLQIKMYHIRRSMLAEEMKEMNKRAQTLKEKIERQEKKLQKMENPA